MRRAVRSAAAAAALTAVLTIGAVPVRPAPAAAAAPCPAQLPQAQPASTAVPWAQQRFDPNRLAPFADGRGIKVAVIDSGVDQDHPQLRGQVEADGTDFIDPGGGGGGAGRQDCVGHGTAVASVIAAQPAAGTGFRGLAPGVSILPIRVSEQDRTADGTVSGRVPANPAAAFASAVRYAVDKGARVINMSVVLYEDDPGVRAATAYAQAHNVVMVAAAGNAHDPNQPSRPDPVSYPAAYDGVIGVGAIDETGVRTVESQIGTYVDISAPGNNVTVASPGHGYQTYHGTSVAAPFVSATAALVLQYRPELSARQVIARILATADPAPGGPKEYGHGVVNPYRALTENISTAPPNRLAAVPPRQVDAAAVRAAGAAARTRSFALALAAGVAALALVVVLVATVVPRGRRRGWRPGTG